MFWRKRLLRSCQLSFGGNDMCIIEKIAMNSLFFQMNQFISIKLREFNWTIRFYLNSEHP